MKTITSILQKNKSDQVDRNDKMVHFIMSSKGYLPLNPPRLAREIGVCQFCGGTEYFLWMVDKDRRAWGCGRVCVGSKLPSNACETPTPLEKKRALLWPSFCENNGIGDEHYDVKFELVQQSQGKLEYMLKFATAPRGIILMRGEPGTGKTYAAMAICEFFTRSSPYCVFTTQKQMANGWLISQSDHMSNYINTLLATTLLVIDDFATGEPNPKFLEFFMELINTRLQWTNRGTVITTNLNVKKFNDFCGEPLADRIMTGQIFTFEGTTRRTKKIL